MSSITPEAADRFRGYSALVEGCAVLEAPARDRLRVTGEDRLRFINGLVTCDLRQLDPGSGTYGFFTTQQGRILSDATIWALETELDLELPPGRGEVVAAHALRYRVADRVDIEPARELAEMLIAGPQVEDLAADALHTQLPETAWGRFRFGTVDVLREERIGVAAVRVRGAVDAVAEIRERMEVLGAVRSATGALETLRVERGIPKFAVDFTEESLPQETGLESQAVSYTKGCYLGQEIVARVHYRGRVNRLVRGLVAETEGGLEAGQDVLLDGESVGRVSTAAFSPALGAPAGLAMLHRKAEPGVVASLSTGARVTVAELPLVEIPAEGPPSKEDAVRDLSDAEG